jgi:uncharacterized protein
LKYAAHYIHFGDVLRGAVFICCLSVLYILAAHYVVRTIQWWRWGYKPPPRVLYVRTIVLALASGGIVSFLYGRFVEPYRPEITNVTIRNAHISPGTSLRIVHISDLHSEASPRLEQQLPGLIAAQKPDVIVFTGDTVNETQGLVTAGRLFAARSTIAPIYAVRGNWDLRLDENAFAASGLHNLEHDGVLLDVRGNRVYIMGARDGSAQVLPSVVSSGPQDAFRILLYHRPDEIENVARSGNVDLYCAGHTHGGQVALPWFGAIITLSKLGKKYESGLHRVADTYLYVNRGIGMDKIGPRVRFFARPEITMIDVQSAT